MKSDKLLILTLVLFSSCKEVAIPDLEIKFIADWEIGDETRFKVTKAKEDTKYGVNPGKYEMTQIGSLEVINKTDEEYELEWGIVETIYPEGVEMDTFYTRLYEDMMKLFKIRYTTDRNGRFKELTNWEDVLNFQFEAMDNISGIIEEEHGMKYEEIKKMMTQMLGSKEQIELMFIQEIKLLHSYYGSTFQTNRINPKNKYIPNIFGGDPVLINTFLSIEQVDTTAKILIGQESFSLDEQAKNEMLSIYRKSLEEKYGKGSESDNLAENSKMEINDKTVFNLYYGNGIVNFISYKRDAAIKSKDQDLVRKKEIVIEKIK